MIKRWQLTFLVVVLAATVTRASFAQESIVWEPADTANATAIQLLDAAATKNTKSYRPAIGAEDGTSQSTTRIRQGAPQSPSSSSETIVWPGDSPQTVGIHPKPMGAAGQGSVLAPSIDLNAPITVLPPLNNPNFPDANRIHVGTNGSRFGDDGMSPPHWGQDPLQPLGPVVTANPWERDPPAIDPGPEWEAGNPAYQQKKEGPSLGEILNKGKWFAAAEVTALEPFFQGNNAISVSNGTSTTVGNYDFGVELSPRVHFGFESAEGPGFRLTYWNFDHDSEVEAFTSDGLFQGTSQVALLGPNPFSTLATTSAGEQLATQYQLEAQVIDWLLFKEIKFPISRLNGLMGFSYASIVHKTNSVLSDAGGTLGTLNARHAFEGMGPTAGFAYRRPIGHTKLQFLGGMKASLFLGKRDQQVANSLASDFERIGADELISNLHSHFGVSYVRRVTRNKSYTAKIKFEALHWLGGGTAVDPVADFGLYGFTFGVGMNR